MKKVLLSMFLVLILSSCSIDWNGEKDKKIAELEKQIQNDIFKKKQECIKEKDNMEKQLLDLGILHGVTNIDEIFYSKQNNTCYYTSFGINGYIIFDYFGNKLYDNASFGNSIDYERLKNKIKELKGQ